MIWVLGIALKTARLTVQNNATEWSKELLMSLKKQTFEGCHKFNFLDSDTNLPCFFLLQILHWKKFPKYFNSAHWAMAAYFSPVCSFWITKLKSCDPLPKKLPLHLTKAYQQLIWSFDEGFVAILLICNLKCNFFLQWNSKSAESSK